ncbi:hypothetical protein WICMUC_003371 [Wickerhamomyces mucosus]|uniref:Leo1-like protein n=1 Tax=Wickerhamomyces mucosus TaxID=1378264 RepID=A0A9P8TDB7_9ASCO|nr:hypothetical protein WICMUC_003371 [Wickerhamomyces mucosus]
MSDIGSDTKRQRAVIQDDEDDEPVNDVVTKESTEQVGDEVDDLFGEDEEEDEDNLGDFVENDEEGANDNNNENQDDQFLVDQEVEVTKELKIKDQDIIRHPPKFQSEESKVYDAKIPNFLHINPSRFDANDYLKKIESFQDKPQEELDILRLQEENTIRWRFTKKGSESLSAESNAQIVEWEDGSLSLKLGEELFDVIESKVFDTYLTTFEDNKDDDTRIYLSDGSVQKSFKFVPTSTNSKIHKTLTSAIIKSKQQAKPAAQSVFINVDPDKEVRQLEKLEEAKIKERRRQQLKLEKEQELGISASQRYRESPTPYQRRQQEDYERDEFIDDDEDDEDEADYDDEEEDDDDDAGAERLRRVKEAGQAQYQDQDQDEEEEEEEFSTRKKRRVIEDDEDDEDDE